MRIVHTKPRTKLCIRFLFIMVFAAAIFHPGAAYAQLPGVQSQSGDIVLESVSVDIWPEYDKPSVLVIYHIKLSDQTGLPAAMSFRIPAAAGEPHAVAWQSPDGSAFDMKYETTLLADWIEIQFSTPAQDVQIEYYDPGIKKTGSRRDFTFRWPGNYTVENFSLQVQQPANATNMGFDPDLGSGRPGSYGLVYYSLLRGTVNAGEPVDLVLWYDKPDDTLTNSNQFQAAQPNQPLDSGTAGRVALDQFLPWGVGALGLLLIAAGSFWYWKTGRVSSTRTTPGRARHGRTRPDKPVPASESGGEATFCYQCGKKAAPGDLFCRTCGTKLR